MQKSKKVLTISLASLLMFSGTILPTPNALADENVSDSSILNKDFSYSLNDSVSNFEFITQTEKNLEYSYRENGEIFKVREDFNSDYTSVNSTIYKLDENTNEYIIFDELITSINLEENIVILKSTLNDATETIINIDEINVDGSNHDEININDDSPMLYANYDWVYKNTEYGSNKFNRLTIAGIAIVVSAITKLPATAKVVTNLANTYYQIGVGALYYIKHTYNDKNSNKLRPTIKTVTHFYSDPDRKRLVKSHVTNIYSSR